MQYFVSELRVSIYLLRNRTYQTAETTHRIIEDRCLIFNAQSTTDNRAVFSTHRIAVQSKPCIKQHTLSQYKPRPSIKLQPLTEFPETQEAVGFKTSSDNQHIKGKLMALD